MDEKIPKYSLKTISDLFTHASRRTARHLGLWRRQEMPLHILRDPWSCNTRAEAVRLDVASRRVSLPRHCDAEIALRRDALQRRCPPLGGRPPECVARVPSQWVEDIQ
ncbi:hypothetical protein J6590_027931, partial [Homalodisca vitripennis]